MRRRIALSDDNPGCRTVRVVLDNRLNIPISDLMATVGEQGIRRIKYLLTHENPHHRFHPEEPAYYQNWSEEMRSIPGELLEQPCLSLPRGATHVMRTVLEGVKREVFDLRTQGNEDNPGYRAEIPDTKENLYGYQKEAVAAAVARQNCLIRAPTGSGKTTAAIAIAAALKMRTLVIVWSSNLMQQWIKRVSKELGISTRRVGRIKGKQVYIRDITIAMQQTIARNPEKYSKQFGVVICDEVQRFAARTFVAAIDPFHAKYRIGISADETRKDRKEFLIYDMFGQVAYDIKQEHLIQTGHILDVEIRVVPTEFRDPQYRIDGNFDRLMRLMSANTARNELGLQLARAEVAEGQQVFILSHRREHCLGLDHSLVKTGVKSGTLIGGEDHKVAFEDTRIGLEQGWLRVGVGTIPAIGQGLDIPSVGRAVVMTPIANNRQLFGQVRGRVCRLSKSTGKKDARLYYLWDRHVYGWVALENIAKWYSSVVVFKEGQWVPVREYLTTMRVKRDRKAA